jgi:hypothetical protein
MSHSFRQAKFDFTLILFASIFSIIIPVGICWLTYKWLKGKNNPVMAIIIPVIELFTILWVYYIIIQTINL